MDDSQHYDSEIEYPIVELSVGASITPGASEPLSLPAWVRGEFAGVGTTHRHQALPGVDRQCAIWMQESSEGALVSARLPRALLNANEFRAAVEGMHHLIGETLSRSHAPHPIRVWNFVPGIHDDMGGGLDRYRVFNQARFDSFVNWLGDPSRFWSVLPTATGIGHAGETLTIHVLSARQPGVPRENPRQHPAFRYSTRFGPRPPCFSRATVTQAFGGSRLLIGGTASVRGEESMHPGSLPRQLAETAENLRALLASAGCDPVNALGHMVHARVYHRHAEHRQVVAGFVRERLRNTETVDVVQAEICRRELLVEIEGVADLPHRLHLESSC